MRAAGRDTRENAGMSKREESENLSPRKPKGTWGRFVHPGLVETLRGTRKG